MPQHPGDARKTRYDTTEYQLAGSQGRVEEKSRERGQPIVAHRIDVRRMRGMDKHHRTQFVGLFPHGPETLVVEGDAVDVAEYHRAAKMKLSNCTPQFRDRGCRIAQRQSCQGRKTCPTR